MIKYPSNKFFKITGAAIIILAVLAIVSGYKLISPAFSQSSGNPSAPAQSGAQVVNMVEDSYGYSPAEFTVKKGVKVRWIIDAREPGSCAASLVVPSLGISKNLQAGENIIEFTPTESGAIPFSCSMSMYKGVFYVADENGKVSDAVKNSAQNNSQQQVSPSCGLKSPSGNGGCGCGRGK